MTDNQPWERATIEKVLLEHIKEQKLARRWNIAYKLFLFGFIGLLGFATLKRELRQPPLINQAHTAVIDVVGEISKDTPSNAIDLKGSLETAFANKHVKAVILRINSPGGSPVQARQVYDEIMRQRNLHNNIKVYAAIEEAGTSAAYLIAAAAHEIYADKTSIIGSIGVRMDGFGFVETMQKLGVQRRLYTAGSHKGMLDPFLPEKEDEANFVKEQLLRVHSAFIDNVKQGRGKRLKDHPDLFSGLFWTGEDALSLGLIDGFADVDFIARELVGVEDVVDYTPLVPLVDRIAHKIGASMAGHLQSSALQKANIR